MKRQNRQQKYYSLRKQFPVFTFSDYFFSIDNNGIKAEFVFNISNYVIFRPTLYIKPSSFFISAMNNKHVVEEYIFYIGMVELISYWKTTCSPNVHIAVHGLSNKQINWWKKLYFNGLGEFFYLNSIDTDIDNFMHISTWGKPVVSQNITLDKNKILVPIGGGKDSAVTLELLKTIKGKTIIPFALNPREAIVRTIEIAGFSIKDTIVVQRTLDSQLLTLNKQGFLNGHTPFSALLAFVALLAASLAGAEYIALSNESSANESTVPKTNINHQYSKSFEFEDDFSTYLKNFTKNNIHYFSFLRPVNELQIAYLFSKMKRHHNSFRSCNVGSKTDSWCGKCPKCLFTSIILSPFINKHDLDKIFHKDMFDDVSLKPVLNELTGISDVKPFECVGTPLEVNAALWKTFHDYSEKPSLLKDFPFEKGKQYSNNFNMLLNDFNGEHNVPLQFLSALKTTLYE